MNKKWIVIIILISILLPGCLNTDENSKELTEGDLLLNASSEHSKYNLFEEIIITINLENNDTHDIKVQPISFSANIMPIVIDSSGNELKGKIKSEDYYIGNEDLIKLKPNEFDEINLDLNRYFSFEENETYDIKIKYHAVDRYSEDEILNSWKGELISNTMKINIL